MQIMSEILERALRLPESERRRLADAIYDSLDTTAVVHLTPEQESELARRLEDYEQNPDGNFTWDEIEAEALAR